jgi:uncharacterized protein YegP (UPF0339 family)
MRVVLKKGKTSAPYTFAFVDSEDRSIVRSEIYRARKTALNGIESVKKNCLNNARYEMKEAKNGKYFFNLKASNGQVVGTSTFYETMEQRIFGIAKLKIGAPDAVMVEQQN